MQPTLKTSPHPRWALAATILIWALLQVYFTAWLDNAFPAATGCALMAFGLLAGVMAAALMAFFYWLTVGE